MENTITYLKKQSGSSPTAIPDMSAETQRKAPRQHCRCTGWDSKQAPHEKRVYGHKQMIYFTIMLVTMLPNEVRFVAGCSLSGVLGSTGAMVSAYGTWVDGWNPFRLSSIQTHWVVLKGEKG